MKILLEDYQRKLKNAQELIQRKEGDYVTMTRLLTKAALYRSFIIDIERAIERVVNNQ